MGEGEPGETKRLERVVRRSRDVCAVDGRRASSSAQSSEMGVAGGRARERVGGRPEPAKEVMKTLIRSDAMLTCFWKVEDGVRQVDGGDGSVEEVVSDGVAIAKVANVVGFFDC